MKRKLILSVISAVLILGALSCTRIGNDDDPTKFASLQSLPLEYGQLKAVTMTEQYPGWAQLWFQDDAGTIRMVRVNWATDQMLTKTLTITRTAGGN
jgi:hypothetical protein